MHVGDHTNKSKTKAMDFPLSLKETNKWKKEPYKTPNNINLPDEKTSTLPENLNTWAPSSPLNSMKMLKLPTV
jgi:hypothetical protein